MHNPILIVDPLALAWDKALGPSNRLTIVARKSPKTNVVDRVPGTLPVPEMAALLAFGERLTGEYP